MEISISDAGSSATVKLTGRLDIAGAEVVALPLANLSGRKDTILVDLTDVSFVASIGLRHLVSAAKTVGRRGGRLSLLNPNSAVAEVIAISGLAELLPVEQGKPAQT